MLTTGVVGLVALVILLLIVRRPPRPQIVSEKWFADRLRNRMDD